MAHTNLSDGSRVIRLDRVDSTNAEALRMCFAGESGPVWVYAAEQSAGRGRRGRTWHSPKGNLYASLVFKPTGSASTHAQLSFVAALAVADAVGELSAGRIKSDLKWPNDILVEGKKVAGLLLEGTGEGSVVLGVGLNLAEVPSDVPYAATCVAEETSFLVPPEMAMQEVRAHFAKWYDTWREAGFEPIRQAWLARAAHLGQDIVVRTGREEFSGRFLGLSPVGAALVDTGDETREVLAGDIFPLDEN